MAQQIPDPKLIDSMAMRYRHDFGLLAEPHKEVIRTTMKQLWEEVIGLGFYKKEKSLTKQSAAVEWFWNQIALKLSVEQAGEFLNFFQLAKEIQKQQHGNTWDEAIKAHEDRGHVIARSICDFDDYYNETYGNNN